jgi:chloride channel 3/4/5
MLQHIDCHSLTAPLINISRTVAEIPQLLYLLFATLIIKLFLTTITFGCAVPGGIFLPSLIIGAVTGRMIGLVMQFMTLTYPNAWPFTVCAHDLATRGECVIPGVYALVGAASALAGLTRTTSKFF